MTHPADETAVGAAAPGGPGGGSRRLALLAMLWVGLGTIGLALAVAGNASAGTFLKAALVIVGLVQATLWLDPYPRPGKRLLAGSAVLLVALGIMLLLMGPLTELFLVRLFILSLFVVILLLNSLALLFAGLSLPPGQGRAGVMAAGASAAVLVLVATSLLTQDLLLLASLSAYYIATGLGLARLAGSAWRPGPAT